MVVTLKEDAPKAKVEKLIHTFENKGLSVTIIQGDNYNVFGLAGDTSKIDERLVKAYPFVENVTRIAALYKKANRLFHPVDTIVGVAGIKVGGDERTVVIGSPCSVEGDTQIVGIAKGMKDAGGDIPRGGIYKPRMGLYAFQGMGTEGVKCMMHARETYGLPIVSELMGADKIDGLVGHVDLIRIGVRNIQNFDLLKVVGRINKPVLLKHGLTNAIEEWIMAVEYIMSEGSGNVIFCECDIHTFGTYTWNILDLSVVPIIKEKTHLPIIINPGHATGDWRLVGSTPLAAIAAGADGLIIEVHNDPGNAWSDGVWSLKPECFGEMIREGREIVEVIGCST